jgi:hypothetical protein
MSPGTDPTELIEFLEPDQLVADTSRPVPRKVLSPPQTSALWGLRIFFLLLSVMVIWSFIAGLGN